MTTLDRVYDRFVREHYVRQPLRDPAHVEALLQAASIAPDKVDPNFWRRLRPEWLWGVSPAPFDGDHARRANAAYRRLCRRRGVAP